MRYAMARYQSQHRDLAYRMYVADCLRIIRKKKKKMCGGAYITETFVDIRNPKPVDNRPVEEIAADIIKRAGIEVI